LVLNLCDLCGKDTGEAERAFTTEDTERGWRLRKKILGFKFFVLGFKSL
jgi:hypothetical protein